MTSSFFYIEKNEIFCEVVNVYESKKLTIKITENINLDDISLIEELSETKFHKKSYFENELFFHFFVKYASKIEYLVRSYDIKQATFNDFDKGTFMISSYLKRKGIRVNTSLSFKLKTYSTSVIKGFKSIIKLLFSYIYISFILLFNKKKTKHTPMDVVNDFAFIHSKSSYQKIQNIYGSKINYYYDSITLRNNFEEKSSSYFSVLSFKDRLFFFFLGFIKSIETGIVLLKSTAVIFNFEGSIFVFEYFSSRIPHFISVELCYKRIFSCTKANLFYSGEKESRYGRLGMELKKKKLKAIGIPHGLAYSYKYPLGLFGDNYYCYNEKESNYLNKQYNTKKFIFSHKIVEQMFSVNKSSINELKEVVFFTEPRKIGVNKKIIDFLVKSKIKFKLKLHPNDSNLNYDLEFNNVEYVENFNEAISNNICLARKSTVLLEALYNGSKAVAVLIDIEDDYAFHNIFPALSTNKINKVFKFEELNKILN